MHEQHKAHAYEWIIDYKYLDTNIENELLQNRKN